MHSRTQEGLAVLATVGSTAPFVGLFGTVWGIYNALVRIGAPGQASIDKVAGPVGEALIMTAIGLAVAVPAVLGYNWLVRRNKVAMDTVRAFGSDLHTVLLGARWRSRSARAAVMEQSRMAMTGGRDSGEDALIASINTTPLVDVMLVLLIIFLITIPVVNSSIAVNLPREENQRAQTTAGEHRSSRSTRRAATLLVSTRRCRTRARCARAGEDRRDAAAARAAHPRRRARAITKPSGAWCSRRSRPASPEVGFLTEPPPR